MQDPWTAAKRAASLLPVGAAVFTGNWLAVAVVGFVLFLVVLALVLAVGWLARRTDADEIKTPILTWRRSRPP